MLALLCKLENLILSEQQKKITIMKIKVTRRQFKILIDNAHLIKKGVWLNFDTNLLRKVLYQTKYFEKIGVASLVELDN